MIRLPKPGAAPPPEAQLVPPGGGARVRTVVVIRWVAIIGQAAAIAMVSEGLGFPLPLTACVVAVMASVLANLYLLLARPLAAWLGEREAAGHLAFDLSQLATLLFLTGGLENPFALMILAPITVSATVLSGASTITLAVYAIGLETFLTLHHLPLPWAEPGLGLPLVYVSGGWVALVSATAFIAAYAWRVAQESRGMGDALDAARMALAREQKAAALGALAAAAAHELGSPLATIAVVAKEMIHDIPAGSSLRDDVELLVSQSARCRDILARLSAKPDQQDGDPFTVTRLTLLVEEVAAPFDGKNPGVAVRSLAAAAADSPEPLVGRRPELLQGLSDFINNAVGYAKTTVRVEVAWDDQDVGVVIADDGPGFPPHILSRLGEPYVSSRTGADGHMGLGVFVSVTLLGHTGGKVWFSNGEDGGARVTIRWPRRKLEVDGDGVSQA